jgi:hypothetical protein
MKNWGLNVYPLLSIFSGPDDALSLLRPVGQRRPPYGRSKRTTAQDQRAAAKRRAVKLAKKRGQA